MLREIKPKNARSARALAKRASLPNENPKTTLFLCGTSSSSLITALMKDLNALKRPFTVVFTKKNPIHPFEDASSLEFFSQKNDASLLCFGSHSKKRPHCLTFIRCFGGALFDMMECLVQENSARTLSQFGSAKFRVGAKPLISFSGVQFDDPASSNFTLAKSVFLDFFRGEATEVDVEGLQWMINFAAGEEEWDGGKRDIVRMRCWRLITKRSGQKLPRVEVEEMGPRIDFKLGRVRIADDGTVKEALKKAKGAEAKPRKNVETDIVGDKVGRIHLGRQDLDDLQTRKMKGLKRRRDPEDQERDQEEDGSEPDLDLISGDGEVDSEVDDDDKDQEDEGGVDIKRPRLDS